MFTEDSRIAISIARPGARPMPSSHQVTATIPGYFLCTNCASKIARYGRGDLV